MQCFKSNVQSDWRNILSIISILLLPAISLFGCRKDDPIIFRPPPPSEDSTFVLREPFWSVDDKKIFGLRGNFKTDGDDLYEVDSAGGRARLVLRDSLSKTKPILSPDGLKIAYLAAETGRLLCYAHVWLINVDGTNAHDVTPFGGNWDEIRWSPDSRTIIFSGGVEDSGEVHDQIVTVDSRTGEVKLLTRGKFSSFDASFTADGNRITFESGRIITDYGGKVFVMDADGRNPIRVDTSKTASQDPLPSPARNEMIFQWGLGGESDAGEFLINLDSVSIPAQKSSFLFIPQGGGNPWTKWSPDGNLLLFPNGVGTLEKSLNLADRYGRNFRRLTNNINVSYYDWSKDSKRIVFSGTDLQSNVFDIFIYYLESNTMRRLKITKP